MEHFLDGGHVNTPINANSHIRLVLLLEGSQLPEPVNRARKKRLAGEASFYGHNKNMVDIPHQLMENFYRRAGLQRTASNGIIVLDLSKKHLKLIKRR